MTTSSNIRALAREGLSTAQIARRLGIRYQHAYNVLKPTKELRAADAQSDARPQAGNRPLKPALVVDELTASGFDLTSRWTLSGEGELALDQPLPRAIGVYAFVKSNVALYVGLATMGLARRIYFYGKPGATQRTSQRLNALLKNELLAGSAIDIYTAAPPDLEWNGLPIHGSAGLELGLIKKFALPWNKRSAN